jgi:hypothetical protein
VEVSRDKRESAHKAAELFNTNRTYVNQASKLKEQAPEVFEAVKAGTMRMTDGSKAVKAIPTDPLHCQRFQAGYRHRSSTKIRPLGSERIGNFSKFFDRGNCENIGKTCRYLRF